jgi:putative spermidine/putrescine transport system permease protein
MTLSRRAKTLLMVAVAGCLALVYIPLLVVVANSFNADSTFAWPPSGWTLEWWQAARCSGSTSSAATRSRCW